VAKVFFSPLLLATNCAKRESRARTRLSATSLHRLLNTSGGGAAAAPLGQIIHGVNKVSNNDDIHLTIEAGEIRRAVKSRLGGRYREGHTCITTDCPSCSAAAAKRRIAGSNGSSSMQPLGDLGELQINLKTGYTFCTSCFHQAPWPRLYLYLTAVGRCDTKSSAEKINRKDSESSRVKHTHIWMPLIPLCFCFCYCSFTFLLDGQPDIDKFLTPYTSTSKAEADEMRLVWDSAQPVRTLPEETLLPFLRNLHLQVSKFDAVSVFCCLNNLI